MASWLSTLYWPSYMKNTLSKIQKKNGENKNEKIGRQQKTRTSHKKEKLWICYAMNEEGGRGEVFSLSKNYNYFDKSDIVSHLLHQTTENIKQYINESMKNTKF